MTLIVIAKHTKGTEKAVTAWHDNKIIQPLNFDTDQKKFADHSALLKKNLEKFYKNFPLYCQTTLVSSTAGREKYITFENSVVFFGGPREKVQDHFKKTMRDLKENTNLTDAQITNVQANGLSELERAVIQLVNKAKGAFAAVIGAEQRVMLIEYGNEPTFMEEEQVFAVGIESKKALDIAKSEEHFPLKDIDKPLTDQELKERIRSIMEGAYNSELQHQTKLPDKVHAITKSYHAISVSASGVEEFKELLDD
ncbi:hypothetical protein Ddc_02449 [Ditylenchus destructor]|nr:hypothetical protein Ddc_02449 [Ditylenchus destructor]